MTIEGDTNIVGLIGHPVEHSFSPQMHNQAFDKLNLNYAYVTFDVKPENLKTAIEGAKSLNIKGLNVTIPHKIEVMRYLDDLDEIAKLIGAVNTIDLKTMKGYNTDGVGAIKAIEEICNIKDKNIVIAGAGGASRAISFYIAKYKANSITILNRNIAKANNLAKEIKNSKLITNIKTDNITNLQHHVKDCDILINTTPLGMNSHSIDKSIAYAQDLHSDLVVFDAVYNPYKTKLIKETLKIGAKPVYGLKMLLYQGAESFKIWTGVDAPVDIMEETLKKTLNISD